MKLYITIMGVKHQDTYLLVPDRLLVHYTGLLCRPGRYGTVHFALRPQKRDGLSGTGTGGKGTKEWWLDRGYRPKKTGETVDRRQNKDSVKAVSLLHYPATSALRNCCFNCRAWAESQGQCPLHCCSKRKKSNFRSPAPPPYSWFLLG